MTQVNEGMVLQLLGKKELELECLRSELQQAKADLLTSQALVAELQLRVREISNGS